MQLETGVHRISAEEYQADPCPEPSLSRGAIIHLLDCPAKAFWNHPRLNPDFPKDERDEAKFDQGKATHNLLLEGGNKIFVVEGFDDWKKSAAKEARYEVRGIGKIPLLTKQFDHVSAMIEAARRKIREYSDLGISDMAKEGDAELSYLWQDNFGVWCRVRPDWIKKDRTLIVDYKSTGTSANPDDYSGHINKMDYPTQSVFYRRGVAAVEGTTPDFVFIAQSDEPPYLCSFHGIDVMNEDMAVEKVEVAIKLWAHCLKTGKWPGYANRIYYAEPSPWDLAAWEIKKGELAA
jgi:hypothetical protein